MVLYSSAEVRSVDLESDLGFSLSSLFLVVWLLGKLLNFAKPQYLHW